MAVALFAALALVAILVADPDDPAFLYPVPIALVGLELGLTAGLAAAAVALGLDLGTTLVTGAEVDAPGLVARALAYFLLGGLVGLLAQRVKVASRSLRALLDTMLDPVFVYRAVRDDEQRIVDFRCDYLNDAAADLARLPREGQVGALLSQMSPGYLRRPLFGRHRLVVETGEPLAVDERFGDRTLEVRAVRLGDGFTATARDITQHARFEEELLRTRADLERSNAALVDFGHVVSHELSEPLATAALLVDTLDYEVSDDPHHHLLVLKISHALDGMQSRIRSLLTVAQVHPGPPTREAVDFAALAGEAIANLEASIAATRAQIRIGPLPTVDGDRALLALVFENLLANALRFRRDGERASVAISAAREDQGWHFAVADHGVGVPPEEAEQIFEPFVRGNGVTRPGTGIGLSVCKNVIEHHGGRIWVQSGPGAGATFHFTLP